MSSTVSYDDDGRGDEAPVGSANDVVDDGGARCLRRARSVAGSGAISLSLSINEWEKGGANDVLWVCLGYAAIHTLLASMLGLLSFDTASNGRCCRMMVPSIILVLCKSCTVLLL